MIKQERKIKELECEIIKLKASVNELKILNEIALTTSRATDIDQVLNLIVQKCISVIEAEQGSILLVTQNNEEPFKTIIRQDDSSSLKHDYHIGANITGWVLLNKEPLIIENLSRDKRFSPSDEEKRDIHSVLGVPIWFEGGIIGIMTLVNKKNQKQFSQDDLTLFTIISVQAGQLIKNLQLQKEKLQRIKETEKLHELDKIKTNFFTNISHEFRTPLTLILGPAEQILELSENNIVKEKATLIKRSAKKINRLANQLLDISKIEAGQMKLMTCRQNLASILKEIISSFQSFAERKNISLQLNCKHEKIILYLDRDKIDKIMSNILSNAMKFTPRGGSVIVDINLFEKKVEVSVSDTGIGIPDKHVHKIFDRFYQVDNKFYQQFEGTGIGLSLTKELVELHKGEIYVESEEGKGTSFKIFFLLGNGHLMPEEIVNNDFSVEGGENNENSDDLYEKSILFQDNKLDKLNMDTLKEDDEPLLLIIEDNEELRNYIVNIVKGQYKILEAVNGEEGINKALEFIPDVIISDVMMPKVDGFELCSRLKTDTKTSHIPVILLTAKATVKDKIEGLETGADDYITKPFEPLELKARLKNILEQRKRIHKHFRNNGLFEVEDINLTPIDKKFIKQTVEIISKYISDSSFNVDIFAENLAVSRSFLHKKLTTLIGISPGELIKRYRLNKAAKMLEYNTGNITEIAFDVGFNDPSYFAVSFKKQFGVTPSQYQHSLNI